jgi:hypothetical protein
MEIYEYIYMLSVTEVVFIGLGSGLLAFMLIPCGAYWLNLYDVTLFCRSDQPLQSQSQAQSHSESHPQIHHIQRHGPAII